MNKIILSYDVAKKYTNNYNIQFPERLPFQKFCIVFPYGTFVTKKRLRDNIQVDYPALDIIEINRLTDEMFQKKYYLNIRKGKAIRFLLSSDFYDEEEFIFELSKNNITIKHNETTPNNKNVIKVFATKLIKIAAYTIYYINHLKGEVLYD